ncbi:MAG: hypothetical protein JWO92_227 [Chitinophagaceae bacterium]|nr:hypothetical protein [Chitinophagaceae bacterium]
MASNSWHIFNLDTATPEVRQKMELYSLALDLFNEGKSYPEIIQLLKETEINQDLIEYVIVKAQHGNWEKIYNDSKQMLDDSVPFMDIKKILKERDGDEEVVDFICEKWYQFKLMEVDLRGGSDNGIDRGLYGIAIGTIFLILIYQLSTKWYVLLFPVFVIALAIVLILVSLLAKLLNIILHKINNEPAKKFISEKSKKYS